MDFFSGSTNYHLMLAMGREVSVSLLRHAGDSMVSFRLILVREIVVVRECRRRFVFLRVKITDGPLVNVDNAK